MMRRTSFQIAIEIADAELLMGQLFIMSSNPPKSHSSWGSVRTQAWLIVAHEARKQSLRKPSCASIPGIAKKFAALREKLADIGGLTDEQCWDIVNPPKNTKNNLAKALAKIAENETGGCHGL